MKLIWLPKALKSRESQLNYIAERNPLAAIELGDAIESAVQRLSRYPHLGRSGRVRGTRELVITGTPFIVAYRVKAETIVILRLLHTSRKWPTRF